MCRWLGVSSSGFFAWRHRAPSARAQRRARLAELVVYFFNQSHQTYGYRRIHADLIANGDTVSPDLVRDLMAENGLVPCQPRPWRTTTTPGDDPGPEDLLQRNFTAEQPGTTLIGDITYIHTWTGFVYLATVIDCATRMVIGYSIDNHMRTSLVTDALDMARRNQPLSSRCIFHSDRGSQYTSETMATYLSEHDMRGSMGRTGQCWDNAMAESFFAALKNEMIYRTTFPTLNHVRRAVASYIEIFYNRQRRHSALEYKTPYQSWLAHQNTPIAA